MDQNRLDRLNDLKKNIENKIAIENSSSLTNLQEHDKKISLLNISLQEVNKRIEEYYQSNPSATMNGIVKKAKKKKTRKM
jgi:hypothetical protein